MKKVECIIMDWAGTSKPIFLKLSTKAATGAMQP